MKKLYFILIVCVLVSCKKKEELKIDGELNIQIVPKVMNQAFVLGSKYLLANGDSIQITTMKCYFSNFYAKKNDVVQNSIYHLFDASKPVKYINWKLPVETYSEIGFSFGIDSVRNHSGEQTGDLDPKYGLVWSWAEGYKFLVLQGKYFKNKTWKVFSIEVGGDSQYKKLKISGMNISQGLNKRDLEIEISTIIKDIDLHENQSIETAPLDAEIANNFTKSISSK